MSSESESASELPTRGLLPPAAQRRLFQDLNSGRGRRKKFSQQSNNTNKFRLLLVLWTAASVAFWTLLVMNEYCKFNCTLNQKNFKWVLSNVTSTNTKSQESESLSIYLSIYLSEFFQNLATMSSFARSCSSWFFSIHSPKSATNSITKSNELNKFNNCTNIDPANALPELNTGKISLLFVYVTGYLGLL